MPVIDISEFPEPTSDEFIFMSEDEFDQYEIYCEYIQLGTSVPTGTKIESEIYCRQELEDGELCDGTIDVMQIDLPEQIRWECRKCGDKGAIINYKDTAWDNTHLPQNEKELFLKDFFSDVTGEDFFEDDYFDHYEDESDKLFEDFEYYLNSYDPDGEQSGGPSSARIEEMLQCDWLDPDSPIYLKDDLPLEDLEKSFFFYNARQFLLRLKKDEIFPLTRSELLKRKVVRRLLGQTRWPDNYIENISRNKEHLDEIDIWLLHGIRILLDLAGLIQRDEDKIRLNSDLVDLLEEANAGQLYRLLFSTYYKEMDMGFLGSSFDLPNLQYSVPFILYKLKKLDKNWIPIEDLLPEILLFSVNIELDIAGEYDVEDGTDLIHDLLYEDLFSSLSRFALLETRKSSVAGPNTYPDQVRITPLLEKFISINTE